MNNDLQNAVNKEIPQENPNNSVPPQKNIDPFAFQKALRTYELDIAETLKKKKASVATIAIAENVKKNDEQKQGVRTMPVIENKKNVGGLLFFIKLCLILLLISGGGYALYIFAWPNIQKNIITNPVYTETPSQKFVSIIPRAQQIVINSSNISGIRTEIKNAIDAQNKKNGLYELVFTQNSTTTVYRMPVRNFLLGAGITIPDNLSRVLTPEYFIGFQSETSHKPIIILKNNFFQSAYASMIIWEKTMYTDLGIFFEDTIITPNYAAPIISTSTPVLTTSSSTAQATSTQASSTLITTKLTQEQNQNLFKLPPKFKDRVLQNLDIRVLERDGETPILMYTFIDDATIAIFKDEASLIAITKALDNALYTR